jgi:hypothetical protein
LRHLPSLETRLDRQHEVAWITVVVAEGLSADGGVVALVEEVVAVERDGPGVVDAVADAAVPDRIA